MILPINAWLSWYIGWFIQYRGLFPVLKNRSHGFPFLLVLTEWMDVPFPNLFLPFWVRTGQ